MTPRGASGPPDFAGDVLHSGGSRGKVRLVCRDGDLALSWGGGDLGVQPYSAVSLGSALTTEATGGQQGPDLGEVVCVVILSCSKSQQLLPSQA